MGIALSQPVTPEELAAFVAYWQAEGKVFHHVQWQQKLARSVQIGWPATAASRGVTSTQLANLKIIFHEDSEDEHEKCRRFNEAPAKMMPAHVEPAFKTGEELLAWQKNRASCGLKRWNAKTAP